MFGLKKALPARYVVCILGFFGLFNVYAMRINLSVAIVAMVKEPPRNISATDSDVTCSELIDRSADPPINGTWMEDKRPPRGEFEWDSTVQGQVLGSYFYGYIITQVPSGVLAEKYGAKWVLGLGMLLCSILTLLTPLAARWSVWALVATRVLEGFGAGMAFPAMNALIGRWAPKMERSRITTVIFMGCPIGTVLTLAISGVLCDSGFLGGWPSVFYLFGVIGCLWFVAWTWLVHDAPETHPSITQEELQHIQLGQDREIVQKPIVPWKSILTSLPVWTLVVAHFGKNWGFYTILIQLPMYLSNILHFNLKKNGVLSAAPHLVMSLGSVVASVAADKLRKSGRLKNTTIRKIFNSIGFFGAATCLIVVSYSGCRPLLIMTMLILCMGLSGSSNAGYTVTHVDMSPQYAGTLYGITNCFANITGFLVPAYVGWIVKDGQTIERWGYIFVTSSIMLYVTGIFYDVFCSAELQSWGKTTPRDACAQEMESVETSAHRKQAPRVLVCKD
ncbi:hypothetical protein JTE90_028307 [Oedothorax gibbosus]|uniref:Sialin n=1 Tax=Oedothorax gibbosus TaxID=931172 RepID=A0AAV6U1L3_9ARAC|nr:hypothetical protein JTE90_028307 [Oedothorax gibbosus]